MRLLIACMFGAINGIALVHGEVLIGSIAFTGTFLMFLWPATPDQSADEIGDAAQSPRHSSGGQKP